MQTDALRAAITPNAQVPTEGQPPDEQSAATEPIGARRARNMTGAMLERELTADNDNAQGAEPQQPKYNQSKGESDEQFAARLKRMEARDRREAERAKEQPQARIEAGATRARFQLLTPRPERQFDGANLNPNEQVSQSGSVF